MPNIGSLPRIRTLVAGVLPARSLVVFSIALALLGLASACRPTVTRPPEPDSTALPRAATQEATQQPTQDSGASDHDDLREGGSSYPAPEPVSSNGAPFTYHLPLIVQPNPANVDLSTFNRPASGEDAAPEAGGTVAQGGAPNSAAEPAMSACAGIAIRQGDALAIDGQPFSFFGINARYLMDVEFPESEVEPILRRLRERGVNTVRVWYFHDEDPERFARLLDEGERQGIRFVVAMADNVHKGVDWFFGEEDEEKVRPHIEATVSRFHDRPEILMWEPINEPNCGDGRYDDACLDTLRDWVQMMAGRIKRIDPCRVVSTSMIGAGNFENERSSYRKLHRKDVVEVFSVHRRSTDDGRLELEMARDADRPMVYGEIYDEIYDDGCQPLGGDRSPAARAERVKDDLRRAMEEGVDGYLLWDLAVGRVRKTNGDDQHYCSRFGFGWDDPLWGKIDRSEGLPAPVPWSLR